MTQRLQHILQLLLIHRHWQVGDVQVGGVLLLLLQCQRFRGVKRRERLDRRQREERKREDAMRNNASLSIAENMK